MAAFTAMAIIAGVSAGISAVGQWKAGKAAKKAGEAQQRAAESQAELMDYNANVAELQAEDAVQRGAQEESRFRQGVRLMIGTQRAGFAAGNIEQQSRARRSFGGGAHQATEGESKTTDRR